MNDILYSFVVAIVSSLVAGRLLIPGLRRLRLQQVIRLSGPARHQDKSGTPTMGGVIFLSGAVLALAVFGIWNLWSIAALLVTLSFGAIGFLDDYMKVVKRRPLGLKARTKLVSQILTSLALSWVALNVLNLSTLVQVPFFDVFVDLGPWYVPFVVLIMLGSSNAVNLTDGLDGLAAGLCVVALFCFAAIAVSMSRLELAGFAMALMGGCLGFLRYNTFPAQIFMGDTGSLALGGALGAMAILTKSELLLPVIGGVFVIETLSVILQVLSFRFLGKRLFRMSPIHHHFELVGWPEPKIVNTLWLLGVIFGVVGISSLWR